MTAEEFSAATSIPRRTVLMGMAAAGVAGSLGSGAAEARRGGSKDRDLIVGTSHGIVRGLRENRVIVFRGIPYAAPTGGSNRLRVPQPAEPWQGVRDAHAYGPIAPQGRDVGAVSEDCLYLNVTTPSTKTSKGRPVMVWLHGGAWIVGSSRQEAHRLAELGDVVVVSVGHRLSALGHLILEDDDERFADSANVGVLDMVQALKWVRDNITEFGGDPSNVTIFGVSGGASKVGALMSTQSAKGLFHKGIAQSVSGGVTIATQEEALTYARRLADLAGLTRVTGAAVQALPLSTLVDFMKVYGDTRPVFRPAIDGRTFLTHPFHPRATGISANVPYLAGNPATETSGHVARRPENFTIGDDDVRSRLVEYLQQDGATVDRIMAAHRAAVPWAAPHEILAAITTDFTYVRNTRHTAEMQAALNGAPAFVYSFDWRVAARSGRESPHSSEVPYVFGTIIDQEGESERAKRMSHIMIKTWSTFARTGNPTNRSIPSWPRYDSDTKPVMLLNIESRIERDPGGGLRAQLDGIPYYDYQMPITYWGG